MEDIMITTDVQRVERGGKYTFRYTHRDISAEFRNVEITEGLVHTWASGLVVVQVKKCGCYILRDDYNNRQRMDPLLPRPEGFGRDTLVVTAVGRGRDTRVSVRPDELAFLFALVLAKHYNIEEKEVKRRAWKQDTMVHRIREYPGVSLFDYVVKWYYENRFGGDEEPVDITMTAERVANMRRFFGDSAATGGGVKRARTETRGIFNNRTRRGKGAYQMVELSQNAIVKMQKLFDDTQIHIMGGTGADVKVDTGLYSSLAVVCVYRVVNGALERSYRTQKRNLQNKARTLRCDDYGGVFPMFMGERVAFHATTKEAMESILANGFNQAWAGSSTASAYGRGVYFAVNPIKADQYARAIQDSNDPDSIVFAMIVCRIQPGCTINWFDECSLPHNLSSREERRGVRKTCFQDGEERVLKNVPETAQNYDGIYFSGDQNRARYDEFVVFGKSVSAVVPAYVVTYTRRHGMHELVPLM